jgi:hypothetical protein
VTEQPLEPAVATAAGTGDPGVDAVVAQLAEAGEGTLEERLLAFEAAHRALQDRLADVEG